jgi:hypothetical protein
MSALFPAQLFHLCFCRDDNVLFDRGDYFFDVLIFERLRQDPWKAKAAAPMPAPEPVAICNLFSTTRLASDTG